MGPLTIEDEMAPDIPQRPLPVDPQNGFEDSLLVSEQGDGGDRTTANVQTPKQTGGGVNAPSSQRARANSQDDRLGGDNEFRARRQLNV